MEAKTFKELNQQLKKLYQKTKIPESEILRRGKVEVHPEFDYSIYSEPELLVAHTVCHNLYTIYKEKDKRIFIKKAHDSIVQEMLKKGLLHQKFDKIDI